MIQRYDLANPRCLYRRNVACISQLRNWTFRIALLNAQLLRVANKVLFGLLSRFLGRFAAGDVLYHALIVKEFAGQLIVNGTSIF
jgi:hypothetical protein